MQTVHWTDPYLQLNYGDRYLDTQDALTCAVCVDLMVDLHIHTIQPTANVIVFESSRDLTLATLYLSQYSYFSIVAHNIS